jgi:Tol biopolymer transport system component
LLANPGSYQQPRLSPDGTRLAYSTSDNSGNFDIYIYDIARGIPTRLTFDPGEDAFAEWTPDSQRVIFYSGRDGGGLYMQAANGTGQAELVFANEMGGQLIPTALTPDGSSLLYDTQGAGRSDLFLLSLDGEPSASVLVATDFDEDFSDISPDGRWVTYSSDESGTDQVYVRPLPNVDDGKWQVSTDRGIDPIWSPAGGELFFNSVDSMMVVRYTDEPTFTPELPEALFTLPRTTYGGRGSFDVSNDGQTFYMYRDVGNDETQRRIVIVENWTEWLRQQVPVE